MTGSGMAGDTNALFTGRIEATLTRGEEVQRLITIAGTNCLRIERGETDRPYAQNLVDRRTGEVTLLFPHNRSYTRLPRESGDGAKALPGGPALMPLQPLPPTAALGAGPPSPASIGPTNLPGVAPPPPMPPMPALPPMPAAPHINAGGLPMMPPMAMMEAPLELKSTELTTNLLGFACRLYELRLRGEVMEIWAAQTNVPFAPWLAHPPPRFGPRRLEEQWGTMLAGKNLFPVLAVLKLENGPELLRYQVQSVRPQKPEEQSPELFRPPSGYHFLGPPPF